MNNVVERTTRRCGSKFMIPRHPRRAVRLRTRPTGLQMLRQQPQHLSISSTQARTSTRCSASPPVTSTSTLASCSPSASCASISCIGSSTYTSVMWWPKTWCCLRKINKTPVRRTATTSR